MVNPARCYHYDLTGEFAQLLRQVQSSVSDFVLQGSCEMIDIYRGDIGCHAIFEEWCPVTAHGVATDLYEQRMHRVRIELFWRHAHDLTERASDRNRFAIRTRAGHGIKSVSQSDDAYRHGHVFHDESVGIPGTVSALMVRAHDFGDARPWELYPAHDLVANDGVIRHLAEFFRVERGGLAKEAII